jgi:hypothetical protein
MHYLHGGLPDFRLNHSDALQLKARVPFEVHQEMAQEEQFLPSLQNFGDLGLNSETAARCLSPETQFGT